MNTSALELFRHTLLRQLAAALPASLNQETLLLGVNTAGFRTEANELNRELIYLTQKGHIELIQKPLNPAPRYRLSATGRDYLDAEGL